MMLDKPWGGKGLDERSCRLLALLTWNAWRKWGRTQGTLMQIPDEPIQCRNSHLPNTSLQPDRCSNLPGDKRTETHVVSWIWKFRFQSSIIHFQLRTWEQRLKMLTQRVLFLIILLSANNSVLTCTVCGTQKRRGGGKCKIWAQP
jgi:hypothetical protein